VEEREDEREKWVLVESVYRLDKHYNNL